MDPLRIEPTSSPFLIFPLISQLDGFSPIVSDSFPEPRVIERFPGSDAAFRIIHEYAPQKLEELDVERCGLRYEILQSPVSPGTPLAGRIGQTYL